MLTRLKEHTGPTSNKPIPRLYAVHYLPQTADYATVLPRNLEGGWFDMRLCYTRVTNAALVYAVLLLANLLPAQANGVFIGQDPDYHASRPYYNPTGAQHMIQK